MGYDPDALVVLQQTQQNRVALHPLLRAKAPDECPSDVDESTVAVLDDDPGP
jgi:hypothetical protein